MEDDQLATIKRLLEQILRELKDISSNTSGTESNTGILANESGKR